MTLSVDEKNLLRQAICDGFFSGAMAGANGPVRRPITSDVLTQVAALSDEEARNQLTVYKAAMINTLGLKIAQNTQIVDQAQSKLAEIQAVTIGEASPE